MGRALTAGLVGLFMLAGPAAGGISESLSFSETGSPGFSDGTVLFYKLIVGGDLSGAPPDSPQDRIDPNVPTSPYAGVGSVRANVTGGYYFGTGTLVSPRHVLTAAHVLDINDNGTSDVLPGAVSFYLNDGPVPTIMAVDAVEICPTYSGFNNPAVNDDLAIITLAESVRTGVAWYPIYSGALAPGQQVIQVGYGRSGTGTSGYTVSASLTVKRVGYNVMDIMLADDDASGGGGLLETWRGDFDGPTTATSLSGGATLGNNVESTLGPGDSGGPSFIEVDGRLQLVAINTFGFTVSGGPVFPLYGSGMGGILIDPYADWIGTAVPAPPTILLLALGLPGVMLRRKARDLRGRPGVSAER